MSGIEELEVSPQWLTVEGLVSTAGISFRVPLMDLQYVAPDVRGDPYHQGRVSFPFSNDVCTAPYCEQLVARTETREYQDAKQRVALLVGESALAANLKYTSEETIILLSDSPDNCLFMQQYVAGLRECPGPEEWRDRLISVGPDDTAGKMDFQLTQWRREDRPHPLQDQSAFDEAQELARKKVIVPWRVDILAQNDMAMLGRALQERDAWVTMMNLTNVLPYVRLSVNPEDCLVGLRELPVTPNAPILTTSLGLGSRTESDIINKKPANMVTGPFFGLENLKLEEKVDMERTLEAMAKAVQDGHDMEDLLTGSNIALFFKLARKHPNTIGDNILRPDYNTPHSPDRNPASEEPASDED